MATHLLMGGVRQGVDSGNWDGRKICKVAVKGINYLEGVYVDVRIVELEKWSQTIVDSGNMGYILWKLEIWCAHNIMSMDEQENNISL